MLNLSVSVALEGDSFKNILLFSGSLKKKWNKISKATSQFQYINIKAGKIEF